MANPNLYLLIAIAQAMGPLCDQVVFVGGCATGLLVDMPTFHNALPGLLSDPEREQTIKARQMQIARLKDL
jgi:hypothetical protein